jgi:hypothetical protein
MANTGVVLSGVSPDSGPPAVARARPRNADEPDWPRSCISAARRSRSDHKVLMLHHHHPCRTSADVSDHGAASSLCRWPHADSLWRGRGGPFLLEVGAALSVRWRSWLAIGLASRVIDLGKRFFVFPLLRHCLTCRRVRRAIAARNGIQALDGMPGAATENK